jgi:Arc/MetJ family transcription regulator
VRISIEINDDALLAEAMEATGTRTKRATVEQALRTLIRLRDEISTFGKLELVRQVLAPEAVRQQSPQLLVRTNIEIDDDLLADAMGAAGSTIKRATVDEALRIVVRLFRQKKAIDELRGIGWEGDLDAMREGWSGPPA